MRVVDDADDVAICHFEASDGSGPPLVFVPAQDDESQVAVHLSDCQSPWQGLAFIVPEVGRFVEGSGKAVCDAESSIRADEFTKSLPIALIETVDVEMQDP